MCTRTERELKRREQDGLASCYELQVRWNKIDWTALLLRWLCANRTYIYYWVIIYFGFITASIIKLNRKCLTLTWLRRSNGLYTLVWIKVTTSRGILHPNNVVLFNTRKKLDYKCVHIFFTSLYFFFLCFFTLVNCSMICRFQPCTV